MKIQTEQTEKIQKSESLTIQGLKNSLKNPKCAFCERCKEKKKVELSNISGRYKRDIKDYEWLCRKCHIKYDKRFANETN